MIKGQEISKACKIKKPGSLCASRYQLEISLAEVGGLSGVYEVVTLTFDGYSWQARKVVGDWIHNKTDTIVLQPLTRSDSIFEALKANNVFTLPDQDSLRLKGSVDDGLEYTLSFKAGDYIRSYKFSNPEENKRTNANITELENYTSIIRVFALSFKEQAAASISLPNARTL